MKYDILSNTRAILIEEWCSRCTHIFLVTLQIEGLKRHPRYGTPVDSSTYKGMFHALKEIVAKEGLGGLYKGLFPSLVKSAPAGAVTFVAYEYISDWLESILM